MDAGCSYAATLSLLIAKDKGFNEGLEFLSFAKRDI